MLIVRSPADTYVVPMMQAIGGLIALLATAGMLRRRFGIAPGRPLPGRSRALLRENWMRFSASAWGAAYSRGAIIIMSTMLSATRIGLYSIAQKISQAFVSIFNVAAQTGFTAFVRAHGRDAASFGSQVRLYMAVVVFAAAIALLGIFAVRDTLYVFFAGKDSSGGVQVFSLWLAASLSTILNVSINPVMVVLRLDGQMARVYRYAGLTFLAAAPIACAYFSVLGMATATLITEGSIALFCAVSVTGGMRRIVRSDAR